MQICGYVSQCIITKTNMLVVYLIKNDEYVSLISRVSLIYFKYKIFKVVKIKVKNGKLHLSNS